MDKFNNLLPKAVCCVILLLLPAFINVGQAVGKPHVQDVNVVNTPNVNANITNSSLPVTGRVGALVQLPSAPFFGVAVLPISPAFGWVAMGPSAGTLGVTSIIVTNFNSTTQTLFVSNPVFSDAVTFCDASKVIGETYPQFNVLLEPNKTIQLQFPTALVFAPYPGQAVSCFATEVTTSHSSTIEISVNGFSQ
jgi:hypothetical protein